MESKEYSLSDDPFAKVHELLKNKKNNEVLHALIDEKNGRLRKNFRMKKIMRGIVLAARILKWKILNRQESPFLKPINMTPPICIALSTMETACPR